MESRQRHAEETLSRPNYALLASFMLAFGILFIVSEVPVFAILYVVAFIYSVLLLRSAEDLPTR